jgi:hypothetical protein
VATGPQGRIEEACHMNRRGPWLALLCLLLAPTLDAAPLQFTSASERVTLLELYTSEGCSSCPPADRWLSGLRDDPRLWREVVPVAFHVDYWDAIGWPDRFASADHSERQRAYARSGHVGTVYTPGFVVDGREWRGWFSGGAPAIGAGASAGVLELEVDGVRVDARFTPQGDGAGPLELHVVRLGFGLVTEVAAGENAGRTLRHDFVVLDHRRAPLTGAGGVYRAQLDSPQPGFDAKRYAVAAWVAVRGDPAPLQAVGGWLTEPQGN